MLNEPHRNVSANIPCIILLVALGMNLLADWLQDPLDPKQRQV